SFPSRFVQPSAADSLPSCPHPLLPQQSAVLSVVSPQVWNRPALTVVKRSPPATGAGTVWIPVSPLPSWPKRPNPQQYAAPAVVIAQVCQPPAVTTVNLSES